MYCVGQLAIGGGNQGVSWLTLFYNWSSDAPLELENNGASNKRGTANDLRHFNYNVYGLICQV
jgi:hypothetical protein